MNVYTLFKAFKGCENHIAFLYCLQCICGTYIIVVRNQEGKLRIGNSCRYAAELETIKMIPYKYGQRLYIKLYIYFASYLVV